MNAFNQLGQPSSLSHSLRRDSAFTRTRMKKELAYVKQNGKSVSDSTQLSSYLDGSRLCLMASTGSNARAIPRCLWARLRLGHIASASSALYGRMEQEVVKSALCDVSHKSAQLIPKPVPATTVADTETVEEF